MASLYMYLWGWRYFPADLGLPVRSKRRLVDVKLQPCFLRHQVSRRALLGRHRLKRSWHTLLGLSLRTKKRQGGCERQALWLFYDRGINAGTCCGIPAWGSGFCPSASAAENVNPSPKTAMNPDESTANFPSSLLIVSQALVCVVVAGAEVA